MIVNHIPLFLIVRFKFSNMCYEFIKCGPSLKEKTYHLKCSFGRLTASPEPDQQAGNQSTVDLNSNSVLRLRQQMLTAQYTLKPSEEKFNLPAITIDKPDDLCR